MGKAGDILREWNNIKSLQKDVQQRSILDAVGQYERNRNNVIAGNGDNGTGGTTTENTSTGKVVTTEYNPNVKQKTTDIPEGYTESLNRLKQFQSILTPELLKKYPEAKSLYDNITKQGVERINAFNNGVPDYFLTEEEQRQKLGSDYDQYVKDMSVVSQYINTLYPGLADIAGSKESVGSGALKYGLRSASLGQYTGQPRTISDVEGDIQQYSTMTGNVKR